MVAYDAETGMPLYLARRSSAVKYLQDGAETVKIAAFDFIEWIRGFISPPSDMLPMNNKYYYDKDLGKWRIEGENLAETQKRQHDAENSMFRLPGHYRSDQGPIAPPPTGAATTSRSGGIAAQPWAYTDWTTGETITLGGAGGNAIPLTLTEINETRRNYGGGNEPNPAVCSVEPGTAPPRTGICCQPGDVTPPQPIRGNPMPITSPFERAVPPPSTGGPQIRRSPFG